MFMIGVQRFLRCKVLLVVVIMCSFILGRIASSFLLSSSTFGIDNLCKRDSIGPYRIIRTSLNNSDQIYPRQHTARKWVLVVDDEQPIRQAVGDYLSEHGFQVTACSDVDTAMTICESKSSGISFGPDCIVSDVRMPGKSGIEFLNTLRSHPDPSLRATPVVLLTAKGMTVDRIDGYKAGADAYLVKPFNPDELLAMIEACIARREFLEASGNFSTKDIREELNEIKNSLFKEGGAGVGNGFVKDTGLILSPLEQNLLSLLCEGLMNKEIASEMNLSVKTVEGYLTSLYRKAKVSNRTELVRWAVDTGYVEI